MKALWVYFLMYYNMVFDDIQDVLLNVINGIDEMLMEWRVGGDWNMGWMELVIFFLNEEMD